MRLILGERRLAAGFLAVWPVSCAQAKNTRAAAARRCRVARACPRLCCFRSIDAGFGADARAGADRVGSGSRGDTRAGGPAAPDESIDDAGDTAAAETTTMEPWEQPVQRIDVAEADRIEVTRGSVGRAMADNLEVRQGAVGGVQAADVRVSMGAVGGARANYVSVERGVVGGAMAGQLNVHQGYVQSVLAREVRFEQGGARTIIANRVTLGPQSAALVVIARTVDGPGRILVDWRAGLALGAVDRRGDGAGSGPTPVDVRYSAIVRCRRAPGRGPVASGGPRCEDRLPTRGVRPA